MSRRTDQKNSKKKWAAPLVIALAAVAVVVVCALALHEHYSSLPAEESAVSTAAAANETVSSIASEPEWVESTGLTVSEEEQIQSINEEATESASVTLPDGVDVYNLLLIGVDRRDDSWNGNADSIILLSINKTKERVTMMSFMRDLYAYVPGHGVRKINSACAYGGPDLLAETLEENYKVNVDNYMWVDFESMADIIDVVGGVDLTLSSDEVRVANNYITEMCNLRSIDPDTEYLSGSGDFHCDGIQAVAYGRIRYVGNADYERTERQRTILKKIMENASGLSGSEINDFAKEILPLMHNGLSNAAVVDLLASAPTILKYEVQESRVPYDGHFTSVKEILNPDMEYTIERIQEELYG